LHRPESPTGQSTRVTVLDLPNNSSVGFDASAFDEAIRAHGVEFIHEKGIVDPVGLVDQTDIRRPGPEASRSSGGRIYLVAGCFTGLFTGSSKELRAAEQGMTDSATASLTPPRFYDDDPLKPIRLHPTDRITLKESSVLVPHVQLVTAHATGRDRLRYFAVEVEYLVDSVESSYEPGVDFRLCDGRVEWGARRPTGVYSIRYLYRPCWYVDRLMHEVRVAQVVGLDGTRHTVQMPQTALIRREYVYRSESPDTQARPDGDTSPREAPSPEDGQFGPR